MKTKFERHAECGFDRGNGPLARERLHAVLQGLQCASDLRPDDIRPGRQELSELHIGGAESGNRDRDALDTATLPTAVDQPGEEDRHARRRRQGGGVDIGEDAFARQEKARPGKPDRMADGKKHPASELPGGVDGDNPAG